MRRRAAALALVVLPPLALLLSAGIGWGYSDGTAGLSGAVPEKNRTCDVTQYCRYSPSYCSTCHGDSGDMWLQEGAQPTPQEKVNGLDFVLKGDPEGGTSKGVWEYALGETAAIEIRLPDARPTGQYASGAFVLNASAGRLAKWSSTDGAVRITGGEFHHAGSKNATYNQFLCGKPTCPMPQPEDERRWAGEATNTAEGSERRQWRVKWTAPTSVQEPHGVALVMSVMLPNGDGHLNCTRTECNSSLSYAPQSTWDWFGSMIPRRFLCEQGYYATFTECREAVTRFILPPAPPLNTNVTCAPEDPLCPALAPGTESPTGTPGAGPWALVAGVAAAAWAARPRRR